MGADEVGTLRALKAANDIGNEDSGEMPRGSKPWGTRSEGKGNVREALAGRFRGLPDAHYGNSEHFVDATADAGVSKWILTGTTREGTRVEVQGCDIYTFRSGKVIRKDSYWKIVE